MSELVNHQSVAEGHHGTRLGFWDSPYIGEKNIGRVYSIALCALMLEVYYRNLATYERPDEGLKPPSES